MNRLLLASALLVTACGTAPAADQVAQDPCAARPAPTSGPVVLQERPGDTAGRYPARTDGPCALVLAFVGSPEGEGPCNVAAYVGRVEESGEDLRLLVEARRTGEQDDGSTACNALGQDRTARVELDEPLDGRRLLDEDGAPVHVVDGDRLLRLGDLPEGWAPTRERSGSGPVAWSFGLRGPGGAWGELQQGDAAFGRLEGGGPGYRELSRPEVRGVEGRLGAYDETNGNHVLRWVEGERGFALQVLGPLPDPDVLVDIADALDG